MALNDDMYLPLQTETFQKSSIAVPLYLDLNDGTEAPCKKSVISMVNDMFLTNQQPEKIQISTNHLSGPGVETYMINMIRFPLIPFFKGNSEPECYQLTSIEAERHFWDGVAKTYSEFDRIVR